MAEGGRLDPAVWVMTLSGRRENPQPSRRLRPREGGRPIAGGVQPAPRGMRGDTGLAAYYPIRHWNKHVHCSTNCKGSRHIGWDCMHMRVRRRTVEFAQLQCTRAS